jgi:hypothetical protein
MNVHGRGITGPSQFITAFITKFAAGPVGCMALWADEIKLMATLAAKLGCISVFKPAPGTFHFLFTPSICRYRDI